MAKRKTNQQAIRDMMNFSNFGALAELFVIEAIRRYADGCAAADPKTFDSPIMNGAAWHGVAMEIKEKMQKHLGS